jgi:hypothetical protein
MRQVRALPLALLLLVVAAPAAHAGESASPIAVEVLAPPQAVLGSDGRRHLPYEIKIANLASAPVTLTSVQPVSGTRRVGPALTGRALAGVLRLDGRFVTGPSTSIGPGRGAALFLDVTLPRSGRVPARLEHRFRMRLGALRFAFTGAPTPVSRRAPRVLFPPLRGSRWFAAEGCCAPIRAHRGATLSIDGTISIAERFAIDWVQIADDLRVFTGPKNRLSSWGYFGATIHAAAPGTVVSVVDGMPEQTPGVLPRDTTTQNAPGNHIVIDIGGGAYAFYAHLQPGSPRVRRGQRVRTGDVIGLLGNSGNSDGPHLHFHVMDSPSPLRSNGLAWVFRSFTGEGTVSNIDAMLADGATADLDRGALTGTHRDELPLLNDVVGLGD